jgi:hypothetical protein
MLETVSIPVLLFAVSISMIAYRRHQVGDRQEDVELGRLAEPADVEQGEDRDHGRAADHVPRPVPERAEERPQVMRDEEGADRDRDDVVEREPPAGEERDHLVERVPRERGGAAGLGEHRGALGVGLRREREEAPSEDEDDRRQAEGMGGDQPQGVDR